VCSLEVGPVFVGLFDGVYRGMFFLLIFDPEIIEYFVNFFFRSHIFLLHTFLLIAAV
jgi:hypothetical protein